ncbi:hypothetical protein C9F11_25515 [Streptomyces sp. YIM 121038]|uniref:hypothetical protein n=1 Tax=Streptomyces sp. YIM 121038 TaxID=2136401 RepID=UPI001110011A|nr:hypothetical protein [Streptomyces sp. YIM 121038]QCX78714.1 hypothetical protein C9F11_25515 [Streptomyces sp. YIM 121038]
MRHSTKFFMVAAATVSAGLLAAGPAAAVPSTTWRPVPDVPHSGCSWKDHKASNFISFANCSFVTADRTHLQSMMIVENRSTKKVKIEGLITTNFGGDIHCKLSDLNPGLHTSCLGPTKPMPAGGPLATTKLIMNGVPDEN